MMATNDIIDRIDSYFDDIISGADQTHYTAGVLLADCRLRILELEQDVKNEQHDIGVICKEVSQVYYELTDGKISKANTKAECVLAVIDDIDDRRIDDAVKDETAQLADQHKHELGLLVRWYFASKREGWEEGEAEGEVIDYIVCHIANEVSTEWPGGWNLDRTLDAIGKLEP